MAAAKGPARLPTLPNGPQERPAGCTVFEVISGRNLPDMGVGLQTDAFVVLSLTDAGGRAVGRCKAVKTSVVHGSLDPDFRAFVALPVVPRPDDLVKLTVWDYEFLVANEKASSGGCGEEEGGSRAHAPLGSPPLSDPPYMGDTTAEREVLSRCPTPTPAHARAEPSR